MDTLNTLAFVTRRRFMALMGGLACMPLVPACAIQDQPITIGLHVWPGYEPTPLARNMGWLDEKQVKLVQTGSATESLKLLEQGKIDGAGLTLDEVLRARENGIPLSVVLVCDTSAGADQLLARPSIKTLADIKGGRVGVEDGALGALMLYQVLQAAGLTIADIQPVSLPVDQQIAAWQQGKIDAAITYEPAASQIMELGANRLFDSSQVPDIIVDVLAIRSTVLDHAHETAVRHLVSAHLKGLKYLNTSVDDAAYQLAPRFKLPPEKVMSTFKGLVLPDTANNIRLLAATRPALQASAKVIADTLLKAGILHRPADLDGLLRPEFLPRRHT